jgi:hypothetical protein
MVDAATFARDEATATSPKLNASTVVLPIKASKSHQWRNKALNSGHCYVSTISMLNTSYVKENALRMIPLCEISFYLLICRELDSNMTDTSQGRYEITFDTKISASINI